MDSLKGNPVIYSRSHFDGNSDFKIVTSRDSVFAGGLTIKKAESYYSVLSSNTKKYTSLPQKQSFLAEIDILTPFSTIGHTNFNSTLLIN